MTQIYETIDADTPFEALEIARARYGNDFEQKKFEPVKKSLLYGFGSKEQIRLTISRNKPSERQDSNSTSYRIPSQEFNSANSVKETSVSYEPRIPSVPTSKIYESYKKTLQEDRNTGGIRNIQEENEDPIPVKVNNKQEDCDPRISELLECMESVKQERSRQNANAQNIKLNSITNRKIDDMLQQMDSLMDFLKHITENSSEFLYGKKSLPQGLADLEKELLTIETPQEIIDSLFRDLRLSCEERALSNSKETMKALHRIMKSKISISNNFQIKKGSSPQIIVLMGPTGVGKTTTLAKLAARFCLNAKHPIKSSIINIDFYKLGASAQLNTYASIFGIPVEDISSVASLDFCLNKHKDDDLIIVDTAGRSQYASDDLRELKTYLDRIPNSTKYLTISSTSKYSDMQEIIESFSHVGFDHIILTKTDETKTMGPAIGMLLKTSKSIAYITHGQQVPEDYRVADFNFFEEKIFKDIL